MLTPQAQFWPRKAVPIITDAIAPSVSITSNVRIEKRGNNIAAASPKNAFLFRIDKNMRQLAAYMIVAQAWNGEKPFVPQRQ
jgi:hypothetical protein